MAFRTMLAFTAVAVASALANVAVAGDVTSADPAAVPHFYGRAGGLTGSDRVAGLRTGQQAVGISYDQELAARTNMSTDRATGKSVGVTYDQDVASRTNMARGATKSVVAGQGTTPNSN